MDDPIEISVERKYPGRLVRDDAVAADRGHAEIVHRYDAESHEHTCNDDFGGRPVAEVEHDQADAGDEYGDQNGAECGERAVFDLRRHPHRQHADKMHGPDAAAERNGGLRDLRLAPRGFQLSEAAGKTQSRERRHDRDQNGRGNEQGIVTHRKHRKRFHQRFCVSPSVSNPRGLTVCAILLPSRPRSKSRFARRQGTSRRHSARRSPSPTRSGTRMTVKGFGICR